MQVRMPNGARPAGEVMFQVNKAAVGWLVTLVNNKGVDKTQSGIARVDRSRHVDVVLHTALPGARRTASLPSHFHHTEPRTRLLLSSALGEGVHAAARPYDRQVQPGRGDGQCAH